MKTITLAIFVCGIPLALGMMGVMLGFLSPAVGSTMFGLAFKALSVIGSNFLAYWYLTVPVTGLAIWADVTE